MISKIALLKKTMPAILLIVSGIVALAACTSPMPARLAISAADEAVNRAINADAAEHAPLALHLARDKLDRAKSSFTEDNYDIARRLAEEAQVDARLAESTALSERTQSQVEEVQKAIGELQRETVR